MGEFTGRQEMSLSETKIQMLVLVAQCCITLLLGDKDNWDTHGLSAIYPPPSRGLASVLSRPRILTHLHSRVW